MQSLLDLYHAVIGPEINKRGLTVFGEKLATVCGRREPFSWRHLNSTIKQHRGFEQPSASLELAVSKLNMALDEAHPLALDAVETTVMTMGNVAPGSIILGDSRVCAYPPCKVSFVPRAWNGRYCCHEHQLANKKLRRKL